MSGNSSVEHLSTTILIKFQVLTLTTCVNASVKLVLFVSLLLISLQDTFSFDIVQYVILKPSCFNKYLHILNINSYHRFPPFLILLYNWPRSCMWIFKSFSTFFLQLTIAKHETLASNECFLYAQLHFTDGTECDNFVFPLHP